MNAATRLHPEEDNRQATDNNDEPILANVAGLGYHNLKALILKRFKEA